MHPEPASLLAVPVFAGATQEQLERLASWLDIEEHQAGAHLTREGAEDYSFFVIEEGEADVFHEGRSVGGLGGGDVFGELAMFGDGHRQAEVVARTDVRLLCMFGTRFRELQTSMPVIAERLDVLGAERRRTLEEP